MGRQSRGKAQGQIERLKEEISCNARLQHVFSICKDLGIDDPIHWMNNTKPIVIDWWIAYNSHRYDLEKSAYENTGNNKEMDPAEAGDYLSNLTRIRNV